MPTYRHEALARVPVRARVRQGAARAARPDAAARRGDGIRRRRRRPATRRTTSSRPASRSRRRGAARRSSRAATATRSSSSASGRRCCSRRRAAARWRGSGRPRCASATASSRSRCPTSSRCAAIRRTRSPARAASAPKTAASLLAQYGSLEAALAEGRFAAEADALRLYRHIATMDAEAPLAAARRPGADVGPRRRARGRVGSRPARGPPGGAVELLTNPALAHLHPTGEPSRSGRTRLLGLGGETVERRATRRAAGARAHAPTHLAFLQAIERPLLARQRHGRVGDVVGGGRRSRPESRSRRSIAAASRSCARPATTRSPTGRWASACSTTWRSRRATRRPSSGSSGSRSSTTTSTTATARRRSSAATTRCSSSRSTSGRSIRARAGRATSDETTLNLPLPAGSGDAEYRAAFERARRARGARLRARPPARLGRLRRARRGPARRDGADGGRVPRAVASAAPRSRLAIAAVLEGGYNLATLPGLVAAAHEGFSS